MACTGACTPGQQGWVGWSLWRDEPLSQSCLLRRGARAYRSAPNPSPPPAPRRSVVELTYKDGRWQSAPSFRGLQLAASASQLGASLPPSRFTSARELMLQQAAASRGLSAAPSARFSGPYPALRLSGWPSAAGPALSSRPSSAGLPIPQQAQQAQQAQLVALALEGRRRQGQGQGQGGRASSDGEEGFKGKSEGSELSGAEGAEEGPLGALRTLSAAFSSSLASRASTTARPPTPPRHHSPPRPALGRGSCDSPGCAIPAVAAAAAAAVEVEGGGSAGGVHSSGSLPSAGSSPLSGRPPRCPSPSRLRQQSGADEALPPA